MATGKLLVVDDEPVIRNFLVRVLKREGYDVRAASDGQQALRILAAEPFDLLLTDIKMDRMDGVALLAEAKALYPDIAVILLTGHATVPSAIEALRYGAHNYLLKPVKNEEIVEAVAAGLEARKQQQRRDRLEAIASQMLGVMRDETPAITRQAGSGLEKVTVGDLEMDPAAYRATLRGHRLDLTPTEFRLLLKLSRAPGIAFDYVSLVQDACGYSCTRQEAREIIGAHVLNLRRKLGVDRDRPLFVESVRGVGYRLIPPEE